jgi:hypothetical protein
MFRKVLICVYKQKVSRLYYCISIWLVLEFILSKYFKSKLVLQKYYVFTILKIYLL